MAEFERFFRYLIPGFSFFLPLIAIPFIAGNEISSVTNISAFNSILSIITAGILGYFISQIYWVLHDNSTWGINHRKTINDLIKNSIIEIKKGEKTISEFKKEEHYSQWVILSQLWYSNYFDINDKIREKIDRLSHIIHGTGSTILAIALGAFIGNIVVFTANYHWQCNHVLTSTILTNSLIIVLLGFLIANFNSAKKKYELLVDVNLTPENLKTDPEKPKPISFTI
jgi:hypothetical protein